MYIMCHYSSLLPWPARSHWFYWPTNQRVCRRRPWRMHLWHSWLAPCSKVSSPSLWSSQWTVHTSDSAGSGLASSCINTHTYTYIDIHTNTHMYSHMHIVTHICTHSHMRKHIHSYSHTCTLTHTRTLTHIRVHSHTYIHMHSLTHICTHSHTYALAHTHTHSLIHIHTRSHTYTAFHLCLPHCNKCKDTQKTGLSWHSVMYGNLALFFLSLTTSLYPPPHSCGKTFWFFNSYNFLVCCQSLQLMILHWWGSRWTSGGILIRCGCRNLRGQWWRLCGYWWVRWWYVHEYLITSRLIFSFLAFSLFKCIHYSASLIIQTSIIQTLAYLDTRIPHNMVRVASCMAQNW